LSTLGLDTNARFCWTELGTTDKDKAEKFYSRLLGWESTPPPLRTRSGQLIDYSLLCLGGRYVGGLYPMFRTQKKQGARPQWLSYVQVEDAAVTAKTAKQLGASVLAGPLDVFDLGRLMILQDPQGASFGAWQALRLGGGFQTRDEPGFASWFEHVSDDVEPAVRFYGALFGWSRATSVAPGGNRVLVEQGGAAVAGFTARTESKAPPHWLTFFQVSDCEAACQKLVSLQGSVLAPPGSTPGSGKLAVVSDPQGAAFGLLTPDAR
jgi:hypothetical protein